MANVTEEVKMNNSVSEASVSRLDMKFEIAVIPVSDVDCAKEIYARLNMLRQVWVIMPA